MTKFVWQFGQYKPSSPSTKELHAFLIGNIDQIFVAYFEHIIMSTSSSDSPKIIFKYGAIGCGTAVDRAVTSNRPRTQVQIQSSSTCIGQSCTDNCIQVENIEWPI